ncbi:BP28 C-terminal domain [Arabidopsis suecica]|uniref:BP28 C-terminal domain n=1 Tax=Arabidopsis suecica TaxID=45249 RepID=A0A8T2B2Q7_ARASU|nr:BP28 C-terminal domain [Arabidopsis suecica]
MSSSIVSQLQALKSVLQADTEPSKRPFTRPSILFSPKEAADFDIESIYELGLKGLEVLGNKDERFKNYMNDLFSHKSREIDRELLGKEENARIDASISSYLRLLSGYLQFRASLETLEYLIRRYKIHIYNVEDVVLCALPYHDTHAFVRIVQLLSTGNSKWKFLDGVKNSGAPPPRSVIVQQCIRDLEVLETLCDYASRTKKYQPSKPVVSFSTAVVVGVLGSVPTVDGDIVKRILPFVDSGLQSGVKGCLDQQAGALMVVGMLANRAMLNSNLIKRFMRSIIDTAREHAKESSDPHSLRLSFMALINFVQLQSVDLIPRKALDLLNEIRGISGVLLGLSKEFNIKRFLAVLLDSLLLHSSSDDQCCEALASIIEAVPVSNLVDHLISKVFSLCMTQYQKNSDFRSSTSGSWAKKILVVVSKKYPAELRAAVSKFLEATEGQSKKEDLKLEMLSCMLDGNSDMSNPFVDSKLWFRLHHPRAAVRCAALSSLNGVLKDDSSKAENLVTIQDTILRQLWDDDLAVVQAALSFDKLPNIVTSSGLLDALLHVVKRCVGILLSGVSHNVQLANDVVALSLKIAVSSFCNQADSTEKVTSAMFPFLLIQPKTWNLNLHVLKLGKDVNWPLFKNLGTDAEMKMLPDIMSTNLSSISMDIINNLGEALSLDPDERRIELIQSACNFKLSEVLKTCSNIKLTEQERNKLQKGLLIRESVSTLNMDIINKLVDAFMMHPADYIQWLTVSCRDFTLSKTLFYMLLMHSLQKMNSSSDPSQFLDLFELCFPVLKTEWEELEVELDVSLKELLKSNCQELLYQLLDTSDFTALNSKLLICLFWKLGESFIKLEPAQDTSVGDAQHDLVFNKRLCSGLEDLFFFFATTRSQHVFKEHLHYRVREAKVCPVLFLSRLISREDVPPGVQIESLKCFSYLCSCGNNEWLNRIFSSFPVLLVPMSSANQDLKVAAMNCIEALFNLRCRVDFSKKNGSAAICGSSFDELLGMIVQQRRLILSDNKFLPSYLTSLLSSTSNDLLVPVDLQKRFDQSTKENILSVIILCAKDLPAYGKLRVLSLLKDLGIMLLRDEIVKLLSQLLDKRSQDYLKLDKTLQPMSDTEVDLLCLLLECSMMRSASFKGQSLDDHILSALKVDCMASERPAIISPCLTILEKLSNQFYVGLKSEVQIRFFHILVSMFRSSNGSIQNGAKEAVLRLKISSSTVVHALDHIIQQDTLVIGSLSKKKKQKKNSKSSPEEDVNSGEFLSGEKALSFIAALLDMLLLKKDLAHRESLVRPLFKLLERSMSKEWVKITSSVEETSVQPPQDVRETTPASISSIQQTLLLILKDIFDSLNMNPLKAEIANEINVKMLVELAHSSNDGVTRNHIFSLFTAIVKFVPDRVLDHIISILTLVGESTVTQIDSHSKSIFEGFISVVIPFWLSKTKSEEQLLLIFVKVLPDIVEQRRRSIVAYLLGVIGERNGLPTLLVLLFQSLISRKGSAWLGNAKASESLASVVKREWEYAFAVEICEQYSSLTWLSSLVMLLQTISKDSKQCFLQMRIVLEFIFQKLQDPEFAFAVSLEPRNNVSVGIQQELQELMKGCISLLQAVDAKKEKDLISAVRNEIRMRIHDVLMTVTGAMDLSIYFRVVTSLLQQQSDRNGTKKVLGLISERAKDTSSSKLKHKRKISNQKARNPWLHLDEVAVDSFGKMCEEIVHLIDETDDESGVPAKRAAISTLEVLAGRFPSGHPIFSKCLASVAEGISSKNLGISSSCLRTTGALINVIGPKALVELPRIMKNLVKQSSEVSSASKSAGNTTAEEQLLMLSVLVTLEAVIDKLGGFLNPHLGDIMKVMVLHPEYVSDFDKNLKSKANTIRRLLTDKIPVRLTLQPLLRIYDEAVSSGNASLVIAFDMLENLVVKMDRSSIVSNHGKIFDQCLVALDIRRQNPAAIQNIDEAERSVTNAMVALTKKLTESEFRPLFIRSIDWAESDIVDGSGSENKNIDRAISFYGLVNKLCESHRSIFVPYFKYVLDGIVSHLTSAEASVSTRKKKKAKIQETSDTISPKSWHLRALVISSLKNCFLHDTGSLKFLDTNNFQVLLKPIVSQLVVEPPSSLKEHQHVPSVDEVDELLVSCIGQMAVASGSDLLWKPLNHEVLMQTRSENLRSRILSLRSVKQMLDNLKEEYLVLLAETIPFLGELLEDVELSVKSLAQDIIKQMEEMSGESLTQYL